jgi:predicted MFS family arabinose efflux permease
MTQSDSARAEQPPPVSAAASRRVLGLLAAAAGFGAANLYYSQPLAALMAQSLGISAAAMGSCLTACQFGYALGMLLLVPLGDGRERRGLMLQTILATSVSALLVAVAPSYPLLLVAHLLLGFSSCLPQMAVPFAVALARREERGAAIGTVMSGLLTGILLSRIASGLLASAIGWRGTFVAAAGLMLVLGLLLRWQLPLQHPPEPLAWRRIVSSLPGVLRSQPQLMRHGWIGAVAFASFSVFWSTLSFQLAALGYSARIAGLYGVLGLVGIGAASLVGRHAERWGPARVIALGLVCLACSFALAAGAARSLVGLAVAAVLLDGGLQASHLANQTVLFGLQPELRNRINAIYMVSFFVGGAIGTACASIAWQLAGWNGVCVVGAAFALCGLPPLLNRLRAG